ncbi:MAG: DNA-protecting protein DprA [Muribaculaceae bacterium]|nr:DNA-protecting protein DprA [Muribaculaceae bacterium]
MSRLNIDEVMALQMSGMPVSEILKTDLAEFDRLYEENDELERYLEKANSILDHQEKLGIVSISCQDTGFPARLLAIGADCPPVIHCKGNLKLLEEDNAVAIIGARAADREGNTKAYQLGAEYARKGYVIVSGLALGCDTAAHRGCLDAGGSTIAIVGNGLDITHPRENKQLEESILGNGGLMLSEQPIGIKANPTRLVARNRLQAALSETVILAQCPAKSGSLHTMRFSRKYGKKSLAASFPHRTEANAGNHDLLEQGLAEPT